MANSFILVCDGASSQNTSAFAAIFYSSSTDLSTSLTTNRYRRLSGRMRDGVYTIADNKIIVDHNPDVRSTNNRAEILAISFGLMLAIRTIKKITNATHATNSTHATDITNPITQSSNKPKLPKLAVYSDSLNTINTITTYWPNRSQQGTVNELTNLDLLRVLMEMTERVKEHFTPEYFHIRAHGKETRVELKEIAAVQDQVDKLAVKAKGYDHYRLIIE